jgi:hypothetical protein
MTDAIGWIRITVRLVSVAVAGYGLARTAVKPDAL